MTLDENIAVVTADQRDEEMEKKFNMHIGKPYRFRIETTVYDGIMTEYTLHLNEDGFFPLSVMLEDGFCYRVNDPSEKIPFDRQLLRSGHMEHLGEFGSIGDEDGFRRIRKQLGGKQK